MGPATESDKASMNKIPYRAMTGSLNYFRMTRPDMVVASSINSQVNNCWGQQNVNAAEHELRYAGGSKQWGIGFAKVSSRRLVKVKWIIKVWVDAAHAVCPKTRRSSKNRLLYHTQRELTKLPLKTAARGSFTV